MFLLCENNTNVLGALMGWESPVGRRVALLLESGDLCERKPVLDHLPRLAGWGVVGLSGLKHLGELSTAPL